MGCSGQNKSSLSHSPVIRWDSECSSVIFRIQRIYSLGSRYALIIFNELVIKLGKKLLELCCTARDLSMEDKTWTCMRGATVLPVGPRARRPHKPHSHTPPSYTHWEMQGTEGETPRAYLFASFSRSSYRSSVSWCSRLSLWAHLSLGGWGGKEKEHK